MGMRSFYKLKDMLCQELDEIAEKGELGAGDLDIAHKLTDTVKNIYKIEMLAGQPRAATGTPASGGTTGGRTPTAGATMCGAITATTTAATS